MGYDFVNVSWRSSAEEPSTNPASEFIVEYQLQHGTSAYRVVSVEVLIVVIKYFTYFFTYLLIYLLTY